MVNRHQQFGIDSEKDAEVLLKYAGYRILARNYRNAIGEIDIIARDGPALVFVEVKARRSPRFGSAKTAVTQQKRMRLVRTALLYLKETGQSGVSARFDVVTVDGAGPNRKMDIIRNAFDITPR
jgi:putative endonuclease